MKFYAGADHGGFALKQHLVEVLKKLGDEVVDLGTHDLTSVDYPDYGRAVGEAVVADPTARGIVVCGTGIGISIAANRVHGVRCALAHDAFTAELGMQHNNANVIAFGGRVLGNGVAEHALLAYRNATFEGGRHQRRIDKL